MHAIAPNRQNRAMPNYRRAWVPGATWFFTVVTAGRRPLLTRTASIRTLRESVMHVRNALPFRIDAWVVLPDHMHAIWTLPANDADFATRWGRIKAGFTKACDIPHVASRGRYAGIWQPRFWEHLIRDEPDLEAHMDYLHYNPVKHRCVQRVADWPYSSFHRMVRNGVYADDWGGAEPSMPDGAAGE